MGVNGQLFVLAALNLGIELPEPVEQEAGWVIDKP
jgi:hypothetical protein